MVARALWPSQMDFRTPCPPVVVHRGNCASISSRPSAATGTGQLRLDITPRYQALCTPLRLEPHRNNRVVAHENGIVEAALGHVKQRLEQKLLLRGFSDLDDLPEYCELLVSVQCPQYPAPAAL